MAQKLKANPWARPSALASEDKPWVEIVETHRNKALLRQPPRSIVLAFWLPSGTPYRPSGGHLRSNYRPPGGLLASFLKPLGGLLEIHADRYALTGCIWKQSVDEENVPWQAAPLLPPSEQARDAP